MIHLQQSYFTFREKHKVNLGKCSLETLFHSLKQLSGINLIKTVNWY